MMDMFTDSDYESYGDSTDTGGLDGIESTYSEHAQSLLSCLDGSIEKIDDLLAFQRGFVHGDIVRSNMDPSKQLGRVVDVNMTVDLETSSGELIEGVNSRKLSRIRTFSPGDYVIHGHWLGRVSRVIDRVTVLLKNGSTCEIMDGDSDDLEPTSPILFNDGSSPQFYPGQNVSIKHHTSSDNAKWLCGSWKASQTDGIICHVEVGLVHVKWITSFMCIGSISSPPDHRQDPQMLTLLSPFSYANWQIGDGCTLLFDYQHYSKTDKDLISPTIAPQFKKTQQPGAIDQLSKKVYYIEKTRIKVDVLWQNGEVTVGVDPEGLLPVTNIGDHDFWPGQFVKENATCVDMHTSNVHLLGVVKCVEPREQIVKVKWLASEHKPALKVERSTEEIVSVYELVELPDASYSLGDIVMRFQSYDKLEENISKIHVNTEQTQVHRSIPSNSTTTLLQVDDCKNKVCLPDHDNCATSYTSHIGFVTGFKEESIEVCWASGLISKVHPYEVFGLDRLNELDSSSSAHQAMEYVQNEMPEHANQSSNENEVGNDYNGGFNRVLWDSGILLLPQTAFRMLNNIAARLFSTSSFSLSYQKLSEISRIDRIGESSLTPHSSLTKHNPKLVDGNIPLGLHTSDVKMVSPPGDEMHLDDWKEAIKCGVEQIGGSVFMAGSGKPERFKQFDCVIDYFDHHFVNSTSKNGTASQVKSSWLRRIQQEWSIITEGLPESICVRVYEERVDLLRASIAGQCGTPYYHGLFFFDIHLPDNYPQEPPHVHYHSGGLRLNPNLYESGKICLSLLNTWAGSGSETWNPPSSTILQLLLSLQALVLNDKPYFNEAGYDQQIGRAEAERNSINYNENAFLLTCKSMLYILKRPPKHFEALVEEHFADRARDIVLACKAYMGGARVGSYGSGTDPGEANSAGFRLMLAKVFPMIVSTFTEKGFDCSQ